MRRPSVVPYLIVAGLLSLTAVPQGQTPQTSAQPQFRVETNYVEVEAFITTKDGTFVRDLKADDFEVLEDGKPQRVETFSLVDIPIQRDDPTSLADNVDEPGYIVNDKEVEGRSFLIVLDANNVAPLRTVKVKELARQFIFDNMANNDMAAVMHIGHPELSQEFTSSKAKLVASVNKFIGAKPKSAALLKFEDLNTRGMDAVLKLGTQPRDSAAGDRAANARQTLESIKRLTDFMIGMRGRRKAMFFISEGIDMDLNDRVGRRTTLQNPNDPAAFLRTMFENSEFEAANASLVADDLQSTIESATRANVAFYTVDPRGLADASDDYTLFAGIPEQPEGLITSGGTETTETRILPSDAMRRELRDSQQVLRSMAEQTGGVAIVGTNNFTDGFAKMIADSSTYYLIGYQTPAKTDGKFHEITIRVKRPNVQVRARKGYYATKPNAPNAPPPDVLAGLLSSPMAIPGLTMRATSTVLKANPSGGTVRFTVEIDGEKLEFEQKNGTFANKVELQYVAIDMNGKVQSSAKKTMDLTLNEATREALATRGLRYSADVALPPGRYQMRLAASESVRKTNGSLFWDVEVPDFKDVGFSMTNIMLVSARSGEAPTVNDATSLKGVLPGPVTATRTFDLEDTLVAAAEIYDKPDAPAHSVDLDVSIKADDGTQIFHSEETRDVKAGETVQYAAKIPLQDLVPGKFVLTMAAKSRLGGEPITKQIAFEIK